MSTKEESDLLEELLAIPLEGRIATIAKDVRTNKNRFIEIDAFDLANVLDVEEPEIGITEEELQARLEAGENTGNS